MINPFIAIGIHLVNYPLTYKLWHVQIVFRSFDAEIVLVGTIDQTIVYLWQVWRQNVLDEVLILLVIKFLNFDHM